MSNTITRSITAASAATLVVVGLAGCGLPGTFGPSGPDRAVEVAEAYFAALADGDAETALSYTYPPNGDDAALTDEVLAQSIELAPITKIEAAVAKGGETSDYTVDVVVDFLLGGDPVTIETSVSDYGDDWQIHGLFTISTGMFDGLGVTVNGQEVSGDSVEVFPGMYELGLGLEGFTFDGGSIVAVTESYGGAIDELRPTLTEEALAEFRAAVRAEVDACIASTSLAAGCGLEIPATLSDGTVMADGTITRTLTADAITTLESMVPTLSYDNPTLARGEYPGGVEVSGQCTKDGSSGTCSVLFGPALGTPSINMANRPLTVLWD